MVCKETSTNVNETLHLPVSNVQASSSCSRPDALGALSAFLLCRFLIPCRLFDLGPFSTCFFSILMLPCWHFAFGIFSASFLAAHVFLCRLFPLSRLSSVLGLQQRLSLVIIDVREPLILADLAIVLVIDLVVLHTLRLTVPRPAFTGPAEGVVDDGSDLVVTTPVFVVETPAFREKVPGHFVE